MKKLYRKGTVHPSPSLSPLPPPPPPPPQPSISDHLSFLPAAILTLTLALSPQDKEVLAYLISCSSSGNNPRRYPKAIVDGDHPPLFNCSCFRCYMSYWARWNSSPNHQLIHEIIDAFEDSLSQNTKKGNKTRKEKRNKRASNNKPSESNRLEFVASASPESESVGESSISGGGGDAEVGESGDGVEDEEKGSVRRFVSFIGERIWGGWGQ
ncbi:uncharacterized protein LOC113847113 [Abrus precatorius]|uniref:Uncharacterized protein LOC113847113 n=1 Tax=Abrus precatorius TaxID=3816 RepID=A0A8B8JKL1_ABRPR|nr:uncharacterized protein LOC113847113 [Abrus precatorius]